jgi:hypothetical protein
MLTVSRGRRFQTNCNYVLTAAREVIVSEALAAVFIPRMTRLLSLN